MQKDELLEQLGETYGYVSQLVEKKIDYFKLEAAETSANVMSGVITAVVMLILVLATLLFGLLTLALWLVDVFDSWAAGFGAVAGFLLLLTLLVFLLRRPLITNPAVSKTISAFFENDGKEV